MSLLFCVKGICFLPASAGLTYLDCACGSFSRHAAIFPSLAASFSLIQILSWNLTKSSQWYSHWELCALLSWNWPCQTNKSITFKFKVPWCLITRVKCLKLVGWYGVRGKAFGPFPGGILLSRWNVTSRMLLSMFLGALKPCTNHIALLIEFQAFSNLFHQAFWMAPVRSIGLARLLAYNSNKDHSTSWCQHSILPTSY